MDVGELLPLQNLGVPLLPDLTQCCHGDDFHIPALSVLYLNDHGQPEVVSAQVSSVLPYSGLYP